MTTIESEEEKERNTQILYFENSFGNAFTRYNAILTEDAILTEWAKDLSSDLPKCENSFATKLCAHAFQTQNFNDIL